MGILPFEKSVPLSVNILQSRWIRHSQVWTILPSIHQMNRALAIHRSQQREARRGMRSIATAQADPSSANGILINSRFPRQPL